MDPNTLWYHQIDVQGARAEIEYFNRLIHNLPWIFMLVMGVILWVSKRPDYRSWGVFTVILGLALPVAIARAEFLMHRRAANLRQLEENTINKGELLGWETWKDGHKGTKVAMPLFDFWLAVPFLVLFFYCLDEAAKYTRVHWWSEFHLLFVYGSPALFVLGCTSIWLATVWARK